MKKKLMTSLFKMAEIVIFLATNCWKVHSKVHSNCD